MSACKAVLWIGGRKILCDMAAPHPSLAHGNDEADASWCSDGEAKAAIRKHNKGVK